jgi:hypothetical protein
MALVSRALPERVFVEILQTCGDKGEEEVDQRAAEDRVLSGDLQGLVRAGLVTWTEHIYPRTIQGHKQRRTVALAAGGVFTSWDSFREAATTYGAPTATLWACLIREVTPQPQPMDEAGALVRTCIWDDPTRAFQAFRPRWVIEDATFRELKEG